MARSAAFRCRSKSFPSGSPRRAGASRRAAASVGLGGAIELRRRDGAIFVTDGGHYILDCAFGAIPDPDALNRALDAVAGVVEHGLFIGLATTAIFAGPNGVELLGASD